MKTLPKAIIDLQGDAWMPAETRYLLHAVLQEASAHIDPVVFAELANLIQFDPAQVRLQARELLGLPDPRAESIARNLMKG